MEKTILNFHFDYLHPSLIITLFSQHFRSLPVPGHSQEWRPLIPFPNFGNSFLFPSCSRLLGMIFFSFPAWSRTLGMDFFHSLSVPEFWEWNYLFPLLNSETSFSSTPLPLGRVGYWGKLIWSMPTMPDLNGRNWTTTKLSRL